MPTQVSICNQAINLVGGNRITAISDTSKEAVLCKDMYDDVRDLVLEDADWVFATKRYLLGVETNTPAWGYTHQFTLPPEVLRVINASDNIDKLNGDSDLDWRREENLILCDINTNLYIKGIRKITNEARFSAGFTQTFMYKIASNLAIPIAGSRTLHDDMIREYEKHLNSATANDGRQGRSDRINSSKYKKVR